MNSFLSFSFHFVHSSVHLIPGNYGNRSPHDDLYSCSADKMQSVAGESSGDGELCPNYPIIYEPFRGRRPFLCPTTECLCVCFLSCFAFVRLLFRSLNFHSTLIFAGVDHLLYVAYSLRLPAATRAQQRTWIKINHKQVDRHGAK